MNPLLSLPFDQLQQLLIATVPHNLALDMQVIACAAGHLSFDLPYSDRLTGNSPNGGNGGIHEGAITTLIDTACGSAVLTRLDGLRLDELRRPATLDLRVDFLRGSRPGLNVRCDAECLSIGPHIAVVRALAHDGEAADPIAVATCTFAVFSGRSRST